MDRIHVNRIFWTIAVIVVLLLAVNFVYQYLHKDYWEEENRSIKFAIELTEMVVADHAEVSNLEESYTIVYGKNAENQEMIVWVGEEEIHSELSENGIGKNMIRIMMKEKDSEADIIRIIPSRYRGVWIWEVFYAKDVENGVRYFYDLYRFTDGELLDTWTLSVK